MATQSADVAVAGSNLTSGTVWTLANEETTLVSNIRLQNLSADTVLVKVTAALASPPTNADGALRLRQWDTLTADRDLADIFPAVAAPYAVWLACARGAVVSTQHA